MRRRRSILGPILLITIGVLFALDYIGGKWSFWRETWPVILVVIGIVRLLERVVWDDSGYYAGDSRYWGGQWSGQGSGPGPSGADRAYPGAVPPPPGTAQAAPPPPAPEYPAYPSSMESGKSGDSHAS